MNPQEKRYQDELQRQAHMSIEELLNSKEGRYEGAEGESTGCDENKSAPMSAEFSKVRSRPTCRSCR
jgi:hypothetical protein